jgi:hypothetical protein
LRRWKAESVQSRLRLGGFDNEDGGERGKLFEVVMVTSDGDGRISEESLRAFPDLAAKTIEGESRPALPEAVD